MGSWAERGQGRGTLGLGLPLRGPSPASPRSFCARQGMLVSRGTCTGPLGAGTWLGGMGRGHGAVPPAGSPLVPNRIWDSLPGAGMDLPLPADPRGSARCSRAVGTLGRGLLQGLATFWPLSLPLPARGGFHLLCLGPEPGVRTHVPEGSAGHPLSRRVPAGCSVSFPRVKSKRGLLRYWGGASRSPAWKGKGTKGQNAADGGAKPWCPPPPPRSEESNARPSRQGREGYKK